MQRFDFEAHIITKDYVRALQEKITSQNADQLGISVEETSRFRMDR